MAQRRLAEDRADLQASIERRIRVLEDHLHPEPGRAQVRRAQFPKRLSVQTDRSGRRRHQTGSDPAERRFAATRFPDQTNEFAGPQRQRHLVYRAHHGRGLEHAQALERSFDPV